MSGERTAQEIYEAIRQLNAEPYGPPRSARTEELVETAEQLGLEEAVVSALLALVSAYEYGSESAKIPVTFARVLKLYDANPKAFDEGEVHQLYWYFKWVTGSLLRIPEVPLETIRAWNAQMRERYLAAGYGLHAVYAGRFAIAMHTGIELDAAYEDWATRPRDMFSDCEACEARKRGQYWAARGEYVRALTEWAPALEGDPDCTEEPAATIAEALLPLVRAGRLDEAASYHRSGYRLTKPRIGMAGEASQHLEFTALTGNSPRGIELLAENRGRFDVARDPLSSLDFLSGIRVLLTRLAAEGAGGVPVPGPAGSTHTVTSLLAEVAAQTDSLAARFDARNGTTRVGDFHRARYAQGPLLAEPLPLGVRSIMPIAAVRTAPGSGSGVGQPVASAAATPVPAARPALPDDLPSLIAMARESTALGRPDNGELWDAVTARVGEADLDDLLRGELASHAGYVETRVKNWAGARQQLDLARACFFAAGEPGRAAGALARAACATAMATDGESIPWDELDAALAEADALLAEDRITPDRYLLVLQNRTVAASLPVLRDPKGGDGPTPAQRERFTAETTAMRGAAFRLRVPHRGAVAAAMASNDLGAQGRVPEAVAELRQVVALFDQAGRPWMLPGALVQLAYALNQTDGFAEAGELLRRALALTAEWPNPEFDHGRALGTLAETCRRSGDHATAARHYSAAAARFDRDGQDVEAAATRAALGQVLLQADRAADAVAVLESLLGDEAEHRLDPRQRAQARLDLGRGLNTLEEYRAAAEIFLWLADYVAEWEDRSVATMVTCELAATLALAGMGPEAQAATGRALAAHAAAPNPAMICRMLRACAEAALTERGAAAIGEVLDYLSSADHVNETAPEQEGVYRRWPERAMNAELRAQVFAQDKRYDDALAVIELAIAEWEQGGDSALDRLAEATRVAAVIEGHRLGRKEQARERLTPVIERCRAAGFGPGVDGLTRLRESLTP